MKIKNKKLKLKKNHLKKSFKNLFILLYQILIKMPKFKYIIPFFNIKFQIKKQALKYLLPKIYF